MQVSLALWLIQFNSPEWQPHRLELYRAAASVPRAVQYGGAARYGGAALCAALSVRVKARADVLSARSLCRRAVQCVPPLAPRLWAHEDRFVHLAVALLVEPFFNLVQPGESSAEVQCSAVRPAMWENRSAQLRPDQPTTRSPVWCRIGVLASPPGWVRTCSALHGRAGGS